ncbi:MAG: BlaI/MecI/CopY family transcriptional regulator [Bacteroidales bacterium]|nr:BlaI/MecI/CopY family transcriptional regulator [Bacteroidales bacterium]
MEKLTPQEEEAMRIVWSTGEEVIKTYLERYPEPKPPYTTLASIIKNLQRKGYLDARLVGNTYVYKPRISEEEYTSRHLSGIVSTYFDDSYQNLVTFFAKKQKISTDDLKAIIRLIENDKSN